MSDAHLRELERRARATGSEEDAAALQVARVRAGAITTQDVRGALARTLWERFLTGMSDLRAVPLGPFQPGEARRLENTHLNGAIWGSFLTPIGAAPDLEGPELVHRMIPMSFYEGTTRLWVIPSAGQSRLLERGDTFTVEVSTGAAVDGRTYKVYSTTVASLDPWRVCVHPPQGRTSFYARTLAGLYDAPRSRGGMR